LAIVPPQIAHRHGLDVVLVFEPRRHLVKSAAPVADADVPQRDAVVRAQDAVVRQGRRGNRGARDHSGSLNERSAIDLLLVRIPRVLRSPIPQNTNLMPSRNCRSSIPSRPRLCTLVIVMKSAPSPTVLSGLARCGVFVKLYDSRRSCTLKPLVAAISRVKPKSQ